MKVPKGNLIIGVIIFLAFFSTAIFGLVQFEHKNGTPMVNCPYAESGSSFCQNVLEHVKNWQQFSNVLISSFFALLFALGMFLHVIRGAASSRFRFLRRQYYFHTKKLSKYWSDITSWLSLFENSPSFCHVRHH